MVPLGGFVKIPGMLRPEPSDLWAIEDLLHRSESLPPERASEIGIAYDRLAQLVAQGRVDEAAPAAGELSRMIDETEGVTDADRRRVSRCLSRFVESTDPRGYWRSSRSKRLIVIGAGPFANILFAFLLLTGLAVTGLPAATPADRRRGRAREGPAGPEGGAARARPRSSPSTAISSPASTRCGR